MNNINEIVWYQKYRPSDISECILSKHLKTTFEGIIKKGELGSYIFHGRSGIGKTTVARILANKLNYDVYEINGSLEGNINELRTNIQEFASSISMFGKRKLVLINEADYVTHATQPALRAFMEDFSSNCSFILTCNSVNRIIDALHSRCSVIEFNIPKDETASIMKDSLISIFKILDAENVKYDKQTVALVVKSLFPDFRRIINELQTFAVKNGNEITTGVISLINKSIFVELAKILKAKDFAGMKKWVSEQDNFEIGKFNQDLYEVFSEKLKKSKLPELILILANYDYKNSFVINKTINLEAMLVEIMMMAEWE